MGIDYITCDACGHNFPDCGPWESCACEKEHAICDACSREAFDGMERDKETELFPEGSCPACKKGGTPDEQLQAMTKQRDDLLLALRLCDECMDNATKRAENMRSGQLEYLRIAKREARAAIAKATNPQPGRG